jgi:hypothetical protein
MVVLPRLALAQGCMPLRFISPNLAGLEASYLASHSWQIQVSGRRVATNKFFVGTHETESAAPGGQPLHLRLNSLDLSATYALSERLSVIVTLPFFYSTASNIFPDGNRHQISGSGVGDVNAMASAWVLNPASHVGGNLAVGLGVKAPTGSNHIMADFWLPGHVVQQPVPQTIQGGDGGWAILAQAQGFQQLFPRASLYASGQYSASLRQHTDVVWPPAGVEWAVPDVYSARAGLSVLTLPHKGISLSAGGRIDGTALHDLFHKRADYYRHAGYTVYAEPGISMLSGRNQFTLDVPIRVRQNYWAMWTTTGFRAGAGGVNDYVLYASWSRRF